MKKWLIALMMTMMLAGCSTNPDKGTEQPQSPQKEIEPIDPPDNAVSAKVIDVTDGDTIDVKMNGKKETIRMLLIDTPETYAGHDPYGKEATAFAEKLLDGKNIKLEIGDPKRGKYDRLLAYVYVDGKMYNQMILREGLARLAYIYPPNLKYINTLRDVESIAQRKDKNIWSIPGYVGNTDYHKDIVK
ncbi:thermonuclease family protein [Tuberibacillus sp. Marseille-P3662]|uniref:thermonuclease family protein n=1 Tax=Tuberibacillus sp. Marseille-P3662 TaxID=1965358 RepID=UPI0015944CAC|nr:thermonuclease family protein [Tuberibacillus sp. Marseille-P3662]